MILSILLNLALLFFDQHVLWAHTFIQPKTTFASICVISILYQHSLVPMIALLIGFLQSTMIVEPFGQSALTFFLTSLMLQCICTRTNSNFFIQWLMCSGLIGLDFIVRWTFHPLGVADSFGHLFSAVLVPILFYWHQKCRDSKIKNTKYVRTRL